MEEEEGDEGEEEGVRCHRWRGNSSKTRPNRRPRRSGSGYPAFTNRRSSNASRNVNCGSDDDEDEEDEDLGEEKEEGEGVEVVEDHGGKVKEK